MKRFIIFFIVLLISSCSSVSKVRNNVDKAEIVTAKNKKVSLKEGKKYKKENPDAIKFFVMGNFMLAQGHLKLANYSYKMAFKLDSTSTTLLKSIIRTENSDSAKLYWINRYMKIDSTSFDMNLFYANLLVGNKRYKKAITKYKALRNKLDDKDELKVSITYRMAQAYDKLGEKDKAVSEYSKLLILGKEFSFLKKSIVSRMESEPKKLDSLFHVWTKILPNKFDTYMEWGLSSEKHNNYLKAKQKYFSSLDYASDSSDTAQVYRLLGSVFLEENNIDSSNKYFEKCLKYDAKNIGALINIGFSKIRTKPKLSEKYFQKALDIDSNSMQANYFLGLLHILDSSFVSEKYLNKVIQIAPNYIPGYIQLGFFYTAKDMYLRADTVFNKALSIDSTNADLYYYMGVNKSKMKNYKKAIKYFLASYKLNKNDETLFDLADAYASDGQIQESLKLLEKLIKKSPNNDLLLNYYGYMLIDKNIDLEKGGLYVKKALAIDSLNGAYIDSYGWYFYKKGDYKKSLEYIKKAYSIIGDDPEILEHLGDIYYKLNKKRKAIVYYSKALKKSLNKDKIKTKIKELKN